MVLSHRSLLFMGSLLLAAVLVLVLAAGLVVADDNDQIVGHYEFEGGIISDTTVSANGTVLTGVWIEDGPQVGGFEFTMANDCQSFTGTWGNGSATSGAGVWDGTLVPGGDDDSDDDCSWVGTWDTSFNRMFLVEADDDDSDDDSDDSDDDSSDD